MFHFLRRGVVRCEEPQMDVSASHGSDGPGALQYERYGREFQEMSMQDNFDGFRLEGGKAVNRSLQTSHSLILGTTLRESGYVYQFGPTFHDPITGTTLLARVGLDRSVNARASQKWGNSEFKMNANSNLVKPEMNMYEFSFEHGAKDWASCMKLAWQMTWIFNGHFSQRITKNLHMGGELTYVGVNGASIGAIGARYARGKDVLTLSLSRQPDFKAGPMSSTHSAKVQYVRKVSDRLSLGSELEYTHPTKESAMRLAYEYTFRQARVHGLIDTCGKVSCFVQDFMGFGLSGMIDYVRSDYKFGFMMHVVPPPEESAARA